MARNTSLKHDAQGFLVGDPAEMGALLAVWQGIQNDVRAIRQAVMGVESATRNRLSATHSTVAEPAGRDKRSGKTDSVGGNGSRRRQGAADAAEIAVRTVDNLPPALPATVRAPVEPARRDERGRFVKGDEVNQPKSKEPAETILRDKDDAGHDEILLRSVGERVASAIKETGSGLDEADPAVKAVVEVAQPMMRGYELLSGGNREKRKERWFRRIWQTLTGSRKEQGIFNKIAAKRLKAIEEKPVSEAGSGGGLFGTMLALLGAFFAKIPGLKKLLPAMLAGTSGVAAAGAATGAGKGQPPGKRPGRMARLFRRVPILGALIGAGSLAADLYSSETDPNLTRAQKDRRAGQGIGGLAGSLGGIAAGAKLGAMAGAFGGPIGAAIGGFVGGAVGMFLGDEAGQIIGDKVGSWVSYLREADIPEKIATAWNGAVDFVKSGWAEVKAVALGTWDWMKSGWDEVTGKIASGWDSLKTSMKSAFDGTMGALDEGWQATKDAAEAANDFIKDKTGIDVKEGAGRLIDGASDLASSAKDSIVKAGNAIADGAVWLKDAALGLGNHTVDAVGHAAGQAWSGARNLLKSAIPQGLIDRVSARRAMETAADYRQGNIAGLDDAHTRALVASTAETESHGGKLDVVNSAGYMGRYQAGAAWLADAGLLKGGANAVQAAMKAEGFTREWDWAKSGGMTRFLQNTDNWKEGLSYGQYLASADIQDAAFKTNSDQTYRWLVRENLINEATPQAEIAGLLKARHISGHGGAKQVARGGTGPTDANGTSARKYYDDLASDNVYIKAFTQDSAVEASDTRVTAVASTPIVSESPVTPAPDVPVLARQSQAQAVAAFAAPATPVSVSVGTPKMPSVPAVQPVSDAPPVAVPLAGNDANRSVSLVTAPADVGQDVRERGIAHIVTGGLGR